MSVPTSVVEKLPIGTATTFDWSTTSIGPRERWPQALRTVVDVMLASKFPMCIGWGADLTLIYNDAYAPFLQGRHPDALGRPMAVVWNDVWPDIEAMVARAMIGEAVAFDDLPLTMDRANGPEETWWTFCYSPIRTEDGAVGGFLNVASDVTAKHLATRELQALNQTLEDRVAERSATLLLFQDIISSDPNPVCAFDAEFRVLTHNEAFTREFERVYGYRPAIGNVFPSLFLPEQGELIASYMQRALDGEAFRIVERFGDPNHAMPTWEIYYNPLRTSDGRLIGVVQHGIDITDQKAAEEELAVARDALRQSQKMDAVGQLTGGVAHDFNNLLTVIRGSVDLLRRDNITPERRTRYLDAIGSTAERATKLTGQLLAFARRQALKPEVFDVSRHMSVVADMLDSVTGARVKVEVVLPEVSCVVCADVSQFETALVNMAVNARDAMDGVGTLTMSVTCGLAMPPIRGHGGAPGPFVAVAIADTGAGIAPDDLVRIFEPFFTTKGVGKGTGLGLSQVFGFAKQSGGDVDVASVAGQGTTFTLYLPEAVEEPVSEYSAPENHGAYEGHGVRVLVVEDNVEVGRFCTQALRDLEYTTTWVASAEEALAKLDQDAAAFDVVFSDVVMPGMGGVELARRLAATRPELPVVLATGYSHVLAEQGVHGLELLQKPYSAEQLSAILLRMVRQSTQPV